MAAMTFASAAFVLSGCDPIAHYSPAATVHVSPLAPAIKVTPNSRLGKILTDARGRTLYLFTPEKDGHIICVDTCAQQWLPLPARNGTETGAAILSGKVGTVTRPEGTLQFTYNEFPLYTFTGDSAAGDTNGQGFLGKWFVVPEVFPQDADRDSDGTRPAAAATGVPRSPRSTKQAPLLTPGPTAAHPVLTPMPMLPTPCNFSRPNFNDGDGDNSAAPSDGDGCG